MFEVGFEGHVERSLVVPGTDVYVRAAPDEDGMSFFGSPEDDVFSAGFCEGLVKAFVAVLFGAVNQADSRPALASGALKLMPMTLLTSRFMEAASLSPVGRAFGFLLFAGIRDYWIKAASAGSFANAVADSRSGELALISAPARISACTVARRSRTSPSFAT